MSLPITAIICVHNAADYLHATLGHLARNGVRLRVIDNGSTDATPHILDEFVQHVDVREYLPWNGELDLTAILERKAALASQIGDGWIVHQDADEILESHDPSETLRAAITRIDSTPANAINFDEFVFLPREGESIAGAGLRECAQHYYFFEPRPHRLMRAWRASSGLVQTDAGHRLSASGRVLHPQSLDLRHYPFLSQEHARIKYVTRRFAPRGLRRGWHDNRVGLCAEDMAFPPIGKLKYWQPGRPLDRSEPWTLHYWDQRKQSRTRKQFRHWWALRRQILRRRTQ